MKQTFTFNSNNSSYIDALTLIYEFVGIEQWKIDGVSQPTTQNGKPLQIQDIKLLLENSGLTNIQVQSKEMNYRVVSWFRLPMFIPNASYLAQFNSKESSFKVDIDAVINILTHPDPLCCPLSPDFKLPNVTCEKDVWRLLSILYTHFDQDLDDTASFKPFSAIHSPSDEFVYIPKQLQNAKFSATGSCH